VTDDTQPTVGRDGALPYFTAPYAAPEAEKRRGDLLRYMDEELIGDHKAEPFESHRLAKEKSWQLLRAKTAFDISKEAAKVRDRNGDTEFGRGCLLARRLVESGVPFVEIGQENYDSHCDNFVTPCGEKTRTRTRSDIKRVSLLPPRPNFGRRSRQAGAFSVPRRYGRMARRY
jgi:hypothetical protein